MFCFLKAAIDFSTIKSSSESRIMPNLFLIWYKYFMEKISDPDFEESINAFKIFSELLGEDTIYKQIMLEELFKILLKKG